MTTPTPKYEHAVAEAVSAFGALVKPKLQGEGAPEANLRAPFETLLVTVGAALGFPVILIDEESISEIGARLDWSVWVKGIFNGHIELKQPGKGADTKKFRQKHDKEQWVNLQDLPNLLYSDGSEWALYRMGEQIGDTVRLVGDVRNAGGALAPDGSSLANLLTDFFSWTPIVPTTAPRLATVAAHLCRLLRFEVVKAMEKKSSPLHLMHEEWQQLLFPDADAAAFSDGYAQAVTFALLLARYEAIEFPQDEDALVLIAKKLAGGGQAPLPASSP